MATERNAEQQGLDRALAELQATASNFAQSCIRESRVRAQYIRDIATMSREVEEAVKSGRLSVREGPLKRKNSGMRFLTCLAPAAVRPVKRLQ